MKKFLAIALLFCSHIYSWTQNFNDGLHRLQTPYNIDGCGNWEHYHLKGRVACWDSKTFLNGTHENKDSLIQFYKDKPSPFSHKQIYFDTVGREIRNYHLSALDGIEFHYNQYGQLDLINAVHSEYNRNTGQGRYGIEHYTKQDTTLLTWFESETTLSVVADYKDNHDSLSYSLDENRNIVRIAKFHNGKASPTYLYRYDSLNRVIATTFLNIKGLATHHWTYTYNEQNLLESYTKKNRDGIQIEKQSYEYDSHGNITVVDVDHLSLKSKLEYIYEYDEFFNITKSTFLRNGEIYNVTFYDITYFE